MDSSPLSHQGSPTLCFFQVYSIGTQYFYILQKGHHFYSLIITCRSLVLFEIPEPVVSVINFGKFSVIITFNVSSFRSLSLFLLVFPLYIHWRRKWQPTPVLLPGEFHGRRSLVGYSPWGRGESDTTERLHFTYTYIRYSLRNCPTVLTHSDLFCSLSLLHFSFRCFY